MLTKGGGESGRAKRKVGAFGCVLLCVCCCCCWLYNHEKRDCAEDELVVFFFLGSKVPISWFECNMRGGKRQRKNKRESENRSIDGAGKKKGDKRTRSEN